VFDAFCCVCCFSSPAPGYFNDDDTLDFMLHLNHGVFPGYDHSTVCFSLHCVLFTVCELVCDKLLRSVESDGPSVAGCIDW